MKVGDKVTVEFYSNGWSTRHGIINEFGGYIDGKSNLPWWFISLDGEIHPYMECGMTLHLDRQKTFDFRD